MKLIFTALPILYLLSGCDSGVSLNDACEKHSELCEEVTTDSWCKRERKALLIADYQVREEQTDFSRYKLLIANEEYGKCIEKASLIEHRKLKEKKTFRIDNFVKTQNRLEKLAKETKNSNDPYLLFYHWSRFQDSEALSKFLQYEGSNILETAELQYFLATYYIKKDTNKTIKLLFHSLELAKNKADINPDVFRALSSLYLELDQFTQAYVWLKVLYEFDEESIQENALDDFAKGHKLEQSKLDIIADKTLNKILNLEFISPRH